MTKVLLYGDSHSDHMYTRSILTSARAWGAQVAIQLGDFGYTFDANMIVAIADWLAEDETRQFYWVDGNHDDHEYLADLTSAYGFDAPIDMSAAPLIDHLHDCIRKFPERMFYCPRGAVFTIGDMTVMSMGGAYSIDKNYRTPFVSWWPQEMITHAEVDRALTNAEGKKIDVMLTHDAPITDTLAEMIDRYGYKEDPHSHSNRVVLGRIVEEVNPRDLFHGHYHWRYDDKFNDGRTRVHGVGANVPNSHAIYDDNYVVYNW
jgi:predicted phosphodiesterase